MKLPFKTPTLHIQVFTDTDFISVIMERDVYEQSGNLKIMTPITKGGEEILKKVGQLGAGIIREIAELSGVRMLVPYQPHILMVHKTDEGEWEDLIPKISAIVDKREVYLVRIGGVIQEGEFCRPEDWNTLIRFPKKSKEG